MSKKLGYFKNRRTSFSGPNPLIVKLQILEAADGKAKRLIDVGPVYNAIVVAEVAVPGVVGDDISRTPEESLVTKIEEKTKGLASTAWESGKAIVISSCVC